MLWLAAIHPDKCRNVGKMCIRDRKYMETYLYIRDEEKKSREILIEFTEEYPGAANGKNVEDILQVAHRKLQNKK